MITANRRVYIESPRDDQSVTVTAASYASRTTAAMLQSVTAGGDAYVRRSEDNGVSWQRVEDWAGSVPADSGRRRVRALPHFFLDITNLSPVPCYGCDPRSTLQIAEISQSSLRVIREIVLPE